MAFSLLPFLCLGFLLLFLLLNLCFRFSLLLHFLPDLRGQLLVASHAQWLALPLCDIPLLERLVASCAHKVLLVVYFVHEVACIMDNGLVALGARGSKLLGEVRLTIWLAILLIEVAASKGFMASEAHKVLRMPHSPKSSDRSSKDRLVARSTSVPEQLLVVISTVKSSLVFMAVSTTELASTLLASEVLRVHLLSMQSDPISNDGSLAFRADLRIRSNSLLLCLLARSAVDIPFIFLVGLSNEVLSASSAREVMRMVLVLSCRDALVRYRLLAIGASWTEELVEICLTVRLPFVLDEVLSGGKGVVAMSAHKVLWVVRLAQGVDALSNDHIPTVSTRRSLVDHWSSIGSVSRHRSSWPR